MLGGVQKLNKLWHTLVSVAQNCGYLGQYARMAKTLYVAALQRTTRSLGASIGKCTDIVQYKKNELLGNARGEPVP